MNEFTVVWKIDIEAETAYEAAEQARDIQQDPAAQAGFFQIYPRGEDTNPTEVDLDLEIDYDEQ